MSEATCHKRNLDGSECGLPDATYGVTISVNRRIQYYSVMVCQKHFDAYLEDPKAFIDEHEAGCEAWIENVARPS